LEREAYRLLSSIDVDRDAGAEIPDPGGHPDTRIMRDIALPPAERSMGMIAPPLASKSSHP
jgi:hypothetical protein